MVFWKSRRRSRFQLSKTAFSYAYSSDHIMTNQIPPSSRYCVRYSDTLAKATCQYCLTGYCNLLVSQTTLHTSELHMNGKSCASTYFNLFILHCYRKGMLVILGIHQSFGLLYKTITRIHRLVPDGNTGGLNRQHFIKTCLGLD